MRLLTCILFLVACLASAQEPTFKLIAQFPPLDDLPRYVAISDTGSYAAMSTGKTLQIVVTDDTKWDEWTADSEITGICFYKDTLYVCEASGVIAVRDCPTKTFTRLYKTKLTMREPSVDPAGRILYFCTYKGTEGNQKTVLNGLDLAADKISVTLPGFANGGCYDISPDGRQIVCAILKAPILTLETYDLETKETKQVKGSICNKMDTKAMILSTHFTPDGKSVVVGYLKGALGKDNACLVEAISLDDAKPYHLQDYSGVLTFSFTPVDGERAIYQSGQHLVCIDAWTGKELAKIEAQYSVVTPAVSKKGRMLAVAVGDCLTIYKMP